MFRSSSISVVVIAVLFEFRSCSNSDEIVSEAESWTFAAYIFPNASPYNASKPRVTGVEQMS